eukprot:3775659-Amphidinium_carterae.1
MYEITNVNINSIEVISGVVLRQCERNVLLRASVHAHADMLRKVVYHRLCHVFIHSDISAQLLVSATDGFVASVSWSHESLSWRSSLWSVAPPLPAFAPPGVHCLPGSSSSCGQHLLFSDARSESSLQQQLAQQMRAH